LVALSGCTDPEGRSGHDARNHPDDNSGGGQPGYHNDLSHHGNRYGADDLHDHQLHDNDDSCCCGHAVCGTVGCVDAHLCIARHDDT
jgi:hypothetical protein